jgi:hypothetical protein
MYMRCLPLWSVLTGVRPAWAHAQLQEDPLAVIHLLDTERVAPEFVLTNPDVRRLIRELLERERRMVPGLRGLALRAGVAA